MEQVNTHHVILQAAPPTPQQHNLIRQVSRGEGMRKGGAVSLGLRRFLFISEIIQ